MKTLGIVASCAFALCAAQTCAATHTVTFRRLDGTVLMQTNVVHGADAKALAPALPSEADMAAQRWDCAEKLASVTNDVTCWALYEATRDKSPSAKIASKSIVDRATPYSLDEYFQIYGNLKWSDEFSGTSLSSGSGKNWGFDTEQRNSELQLYTSGSSNNYIVSGGTLKLRAMRESSGGKSFTSGSITSSGKVAFKYGRCEIRAKLTKQQGTWPAFWLLGESSMWPHCGELDVFEQVNGSEWIAGNFHLAAGGLFNFSTIPNSALACTEDGTHWGDAFHRIGVIMTEHEIVWYVDDHIFKRMDVRNKDRYPTTADNHWYVLLNLAFGGTWPGQTSPGSSSIANFQSGDYEIDYCRIFTNETEGNTVVREAEPEGARLVKPVKATVWRGWQMFYGASGAGYYQSHLVDEEGVSERTAIESLHIRSALREYFERDGMDIVTFLTRPSENKGPKDYYVPFNVPGVTTLLLSPEQGSGWKEAFADTREKLLSGVLFNKERFSASRSAVGTLPLSNAADYTNCCAVVAELVERETGAKVKVVSVNLCKAEGTDYGTLFGKLNAFKGERTILLFQSMSSDFHDPLKGEAASRLDKAYHYLGEYRTWPAYQFSYATTNCVFATAKNPAPLSVPNSLGQPSGVHTNQAYCATVQFDEEPEIVVEYGQLDQDAFAKKIDVTFDGYSGTELADFPVLVKLSTAISGFKYSDFALADGGDLRFADSTGKLLPHEIDTWDPSGVSTIWVKVPTLAANAKITACYGCANPPEVAAKDVWDDGYVGVWHLGESALPMKASGGTFGDFADATGTGIAYGASGIVGGSVDFGAPGNGRMLDAADHTRLDGYEKCTVEAWTFATGRNAGESAAILSKRTAYNSDTSFYIFDDSANTIVYVSSNGTSSSWCTSISSVPSDAWTYQVFAFDAGSVKTYKNGSAASSGTSSIKKIFSCASDLHLGGYNAGDSRNFPGKIDEVRISKVARSAAWIKATHDTVTKDDFATYELRAGEEPPPDPPEPSVTFAKEVTVAFSGYSGVALSDFPVLVRLSENIPGFSYADFTLPDGGDLRFFDADGNLLAHDVDTWNEEGVSTVWVKVPTLSSATAVMAKYGCSGTPPAVSAKDVWSNGYVGVWHLGESELPMKESSETSSDFTSSSGDTIGYAADGVVGRSVDFPADGLYNALVAPDHDALDGFTAFTLEAWTFQREHKAGAGILSKRKEYTSEDAYYVGDSGSSATFCIGTNRNAAARWSFNQEPSMGKWNHLVYSADMAATSKNVHGYRNGVMNGWEPDVTFLGAMGNCASDLVLGNLAADKKDSSFNGRIDEVRISSVARSADWVKATYDTVMKPGFATYSTAEGTLSGYAAWANAKELAGGFDESDAKGVPNAIRYAFDIDPEKGADEIGEPVLQVVRDADGNPSVLARDLASGRGDLAFGVFATTDLGDWSQATIVPMGKFADGLWKPVASEDSAYVFPDKMFFKFAIDLK